MRGCLARSVLAVLMVSWLGACAASGPLGSAAQATAAGEWRIERKVDSVTGGTLTNVLIQSSNTSHSGLALIPHALLQFACLKGQLLIHLQFAFQVGSKGDSEVVYRFGEKPSHRVDARFLRGLKIVVIEKKGDVARFLDELKKADVLYLVITSLAKGRTSAEFRVTGAPAAIEAARAACH